MPPFFTGASVLLRALAALISMEIVKTCLSPANVAALRFAECLN